jgi:hypothetical protein
MKKSILVLIIGIVIVACGKDEISSINSVNWKNRMANLTSEKSLEIGKTYLSVYSEIYSLTEHRKHGLTATISMRNTSDTDTIYIESAKYYNTKGLQIRNYFKNPIYILPMETVEIIIDQVDLVGGTGGNFTFDWRVKPNTTDPLFEAVMISTSGQQGLSFSTVGKRVK